MNKISNLNPEEFQIKIDNLVKEIKVKTQSNVIEGIIEEIATNRIIYQEIVKKLDIIDSQMIINNIELPIYFPSKVADEIIITADYPLSAENGFYEMEYDDQGNTMRWTGLSSSFFFDLCFDRTKPKEIILEISSPLSEKNITELKCFIDNIETKVTTKNNKGVEEIRALIPKNNSINNTKISFVVPELIKPCEINSDSKDNRNLGIIFYQLLIKAISH